MSYWEYLSGSFPSLNNSNDGWVSGKIFFWVFVLFMGETRPPNLLNTQIYSKQAHSKKSWNGVKNITITWLLAMRLDIFILIRLIQTIILEDQISSRKRKIRKRNFSDCCIFWIASIFIACVLQTLAYWTVYIPHKIFTYSIYSLRTGLYHLSSPPITIPMTFAKL